MAGAVTDPALLATLPLVFGIMTFCYSGHGVFPSIQASMKEPEKFPQVGAMLRAGFSGCQGKGERAGELTLLPFSIVANHQFHPFFSAIRS